MSGSPAGRRPRCPKKRRSRSRTTTTLYVSASGAGRPHDTADAPLAHRPIWGALYAPARTDPTRRASRTTPTSRTRRPPTRSPTTESRTGQTRISWPPTAHPRRPRVAARPGMLPGSSWPGTPRRTLGLDVAQQVRPLRHILLPTCPSATTCPRYPRRIRDPVDPCGAFTLSTRADRRRHHHHVPGAQIQPRTVRQVRHYQSQLVTMHIAGRRASPRRRHRQRNRATPDRQQRRLHPHPWHLPSAQHRRRPRIRSAHCVHPATPA